MASSRCWLSNLCLTMEFPKIEINQNQLIQEIEMLASISDADPPAVTRILFTETDLKGRAYVSQLAREAGLVIREDGIGNLFMSWNGSAPGLEPIATGSHTDAIPFSGKYDGVVGVLGAIEAVRALKRSGFHPKRTLEIIMFTAEEPTRFGIGCLGSRALCGNLSPEQLILLHDPDESSFEKVRQEAGYNGGLDSVKLEQGHYKKFVELHIEQGPRLEMSGVDIGAVTAIAAPATLRVTIYGEGGHAGAVLMPGRHDALIPSAKVVQAVQKIALECPSEFAVATTGRLEVFPGAVNSIPSQVMMEIDIRDVYQHTRDEMVEKIERAVKTICESEELDYEVEIINADLPVTCDAGVGKNH